MISPQNQIEFKKQYKSEELIGFFETLTDIEFKLSKSLHKTLIFHGYVAKSFKFVFDIRLNLKKFNTKSRNFPFYAKFGVKKGVFLNLPDLKDFVTRHDFHTTIFRWRMCPYTCNACFKQTDDSVCIDASPLCPGKARYCSVSYYIPLMHRFDFNEFRSN